MASRRLLVLGVGPLPHESRDKLFAPGLRVDFIARKLAESGHDVTVGRALFETLSKGAPDPKEKAPGGDSAGAKPPFDVFEIGDVSWWLCQMLCLGG